MTAAPRRPDTSLAHRLGQTIDEAMTAMHEASANGEIMQGDTYHDTTNSKTFDALARVTKSWETASDVLDAIEHGEIPDVMVCSDVTSVLREVLDRMVGHRATASDLHLAWNPAEVVTQLILEIETGKYEVKKCN